MVKDDRKIAMFHSPFRAVTLGYGIALIAMCTNFGMMSDFYLMDGLTDAVALTPYVACDYDQVVDIIVDATNLALTPLLGRD